MSTLSAQFDEALRAQVLAETKATILAARKRRFRLRPRPWMWCAGALALGPVVGTLQARQSPPKSRLPFGPNNLISAESQGAGTGIQELLPPSSSSNSFPIVAVAPTSSMDEPPESPRQEIASLATPQRSTRPSAGVPEPCEGCDRDGLTTEEEPTEVIFDADHQASSEAPIEEGRPEAKSSTVNLGSRFDAVLEQPVLTGGTGSPVIARLSQAVARDQKVVIPAGTELVGEAFATARDDRVQMVFKAFVLEGKTVPFHGVALGADSVFGVTGKVERKGSAAKSGLGKVLGKVGRVLTLGRLGGGGLADAAVEGLAESAGHGLEDLDRSWRRSDKVIRLKAGTRFTVYVRDDVVIP